MKRRTVLMPVVTIAASVALASNSTATYTIGSETNSISVDTTKVIDIEEVVVIATPKENKKLRQLPVSATSLSQNEMRNNSVNNIKSLSGLVPNLFIPDYGSKLTTSVYVRGIGSRINTPAVGLYVDNIPFIDKSAFDFNYSDIEHIDVMRGPQGTLYGRNTMGGLIRIFTKSPFSYQGTDITLSAATYNNYKASLSHYHRISDKFAFSANFFYDHKGGFFKNAARDNERIDKSDEFGGRFRFIYLPKDNLKLDFTLNYEYSDQGGYPYKLVSLKENDPFYNDLKDDLGKIAYNNECGYKRNLLNGGVNIEHQADNFIFSSVTGFQWLDDQMDLDQDFTKKDIYTMTHKQNSKTISQEFVIKSKPGKRWQWTTGISGFYQWLDTEAPVTFHEDGIGWINGMTNSMGNKYMPVIPIEKSINMGPMGNATIKGQMSMAFSDVIDGTQLQVPGFFQTPLLNTAVFHQSTFNDLFGVEGLSFTAGLRMDYENMKMDYNSSCDYKHTYSLTGNMVIDKFEMPNRPGVRPNGKGMPNIPGMPQLPIEQKIEMVPATTFSQSIKYTGKLSHDYIQLLPKFAVQYDFDRNNNVYATVSKGYRSGGYNIQMFSDIIQNDMRSNNMRDVSNATIKALEKIPPQIRPMIGEETLQKIVGMMIGMAQKQEVDVKKTTLYKPEYSWNYEVGSHISLIDNRLMMDLAAFYMVTHDQQISQFAKSGLGRITINAGKSRSAGAEIALMAQITDEFSLNGNYGFTHATFTDYVVDEKLNYNGKFVPFVPKHTFNIGGQYVFNISSRCNWLDNIVINANYKGAGRIYWTEDNNAKQDLYGTLNGRISFNKGKGQVSLWINNALNKDYQAFYFESMDRGFAQMGRPMQIGVDLRCRF